MQTAVISRFYTIFIKNVGLFHLKLLLLYFPGTTSFQQFQTENNVIQNTFYEEEYSYAE